MRPLLTLFALMMLALAPITAVAAATASSMPASPPTPSPSQADSIGIRLLDIPASAQDDPRARSYIVDRLTPGSEIKRRVRVENNTLTQQTVFVYPGAAHISGGAFSGDEPGVKNELTTWMQVSQPKLDLAAGASAEVLTTIKVPAAAAESEQYGAIWAEVRSASTGTIVQASRVGVRIYLSVGPGNGKPADFTITSVTPGRSNDGNPEISALVTNTGGRAIDITGNLSLADGPGGLSAGPFTVPTATTVAPGETQTVAFRPPGVLPAGPWTAQIKLRSGLLERQASATITFPDAGPGVAVTPSNDDGMPWQVAAVVGAAAIVAVLGTVSIIRRRRRSRFSVAAPGSRRALRERAGARG